MKLEIALGDGAETGGPMEAFSFAVMPKGDEKDIREANKDLEDSARRFKSALHDSLVALGSDEEVVREFLPPAVVSVLNEHRHFIKLVYFSGPPRPASTSPASRASCAARRRARRRPDGARAQTACRWARSARATRARASSSSSTSSRPSGSPRLASSSRRRRPRPDAASSIHSSAESLRVC